MPYEQKDNAGSLFRTKEKRLEKSPDYSGKLMVNGTMFRVSGWKKTTRAGETFLSLGVRPMDGDDARTARPAEDDIAF